ncbi:putative phosphoglycerate mutase [Pseudorhizobium tarimense]|uniref:Phosphoglycerate mutase n=1 Tax=Pseudorhizobium tarimense TaxID=1079109 RepID=A0ABV2H107_9HYPH|nr:histidine phosphatase family protein [Pseudorhizobium tarimense]MCJ8517545.1 histidine phosphatase family protein [Pseudorhizobium tarimense]
MLIYMIRHGQTDWNAEGRLQGQKDISLNALGRVQASRNGEMLLRVPGSDIAGFDFVSSPLSRTRETMERLRGAMGLNPDDYRIDERLLELSFGDWEGQTLEEVGRIAPERVVARLEQKWNFIPPGPSAESYEILSWRVGAWLRSLAGPTVAVTHGGVVRSVFRLVTNLSEDQAATMTVPQDKILKVDLADGTLHWF